MKLDKIKIGKKQVFLLIGVILLLTLYILFGTESVILVIGILLMAIPLYLILSLLQLKIGEKIIFSLFMGIGIYSSLVYWFGFLFSSLKIAIGIAFLSLILYWIVMKKFIKNIKYREEIILLGLFVFMFVISLVIKYTIINHLPIPEHAAEYIKCLEGNAQKYCSDLVKYMRFS